MVACERRSRRGARALDDFRLLERHFGLLQASRVTRTRRRQPDTVPLANTALHAIGYLLQQQIAHLVPERVVDVLEAIEVDEQQSERLSGSARGDDALFQTIVEQHAVGQFGQRIARRQVADARLGRLAVGDLATGAALADALAGAVEQAHRVDQQPARFALTIDDHVLEIAEGSVRALVVAQPIAHPLGFAWRHEFGRRAPDQLLVGVTPHALHTTGDVAHAAVEVGPPDILSAAAAKSRNRVSLSRNAASAARRASSRWKLSSANDRFMAIFSRQEHEPIVEKLVCWELQMQRPDHLALKAQQESSHRADAQSAKTRQGWAARVGQNVVAYGVDAGAQRLTEGPWPSSTPVVDGDRKARHVALVLSAKRRSGTNPVSRSSIAISANTNAVFHRD